MASNADSTKPTILVVHGAWHNPAHFKPLMDLLEAHGYETICPQQPSDGATPPTVTLYEDAQTIRSTLADLIEPQGKNVIVAMHSYGGVVGTEAVDETLGAKQRQIRGLSGGVTHLVYLCSFLLSEGNSLGYAFGGQLPPFIKTEVSDLHSRQGLECSSLILSPLHNPSPLPSLTFLAPMNTRRHSPTPFSPPLLPCHAAGLNQQ